MALLSDLELLLSMAQWVKWGPVGRFFRAWAVPPPQRGKPLASRSVQPIAEVDLGKVTVTADDEGRVRRAIRRITDWLSVIGVRDPSGYRPPRMGSSLPMRRYLAWSVRWAIDLEIGGNSAWPERVLLSDGRAAILADREVVLGPCRVPAPEAEEFRKAARRFDATFGHPGQLPKQSRFLALAAVGFAEAVLAARNLRYLAPPPWCRRPLPPER